MMKWKINNQHLFSIVLLLWFYLVANNSYTYAMCVGTTTLAQGDNVTATTTGNNTSSGFVTLYLLTNQSADVVETSNTGVFSTTDLSIGVEYQIYVLNYDSGNPPSALPLSEGQSIGLINNGCYNSIDFTHEILCLNVQAPVNCLASMDVAQGANISMTTTTNNTNTDYITLYVLADQSGIIITSNGTGTFPTGSLTVGDDITTIGATTMGCYDTDFLTEYLCVTVHVLPTIISVTPGCTGGPGTETITIDANTTSGNPLEYSIGGTFQSSNLFSGLADGTYTVTVRDATTLCLSTTTSAAISCLPLCPTTNRVIDNDVVCVDGTAELVDWQTAVDNANNNGITGAMGPFYSSVPTTANNFPQPIDNATYDGNNCSTETENYYAYYICDDDGSSLPAGNYTLILYPDLSQQSNTVQNAGGCCPSLQLQCTIGYSVTSDVANCNSQNSVGAITFTISLNNPPTALGAACTNTTIASTYDCRTCLTANPANGNFNFCVNDADVDLSLDGAAGVSVANDPSSTFAGLEWYVQGNTPGTDPAYTAGNTTAVDHCNTTNVLVEAYLLCDLNGDGFTGGTDDSYVAAGSITITVYPDVSVQNNVIVNNGSCCPTLQLECPTGYNYTNTLDNITGDPDCINQQGEGTFNFIVQLDNPPTGLETTPCLSNTILATYRCCIAEAGILVNEPPCPQTDFRIEVSGQTTDADYDTWLLITDANGDIVDAIDLAGATVLTIPYDVWAGYLGYGLNYTFYSYNYQLDEPPNPDPIGATNLADIGHVDNGCFDLSDVGLVEYIPKDFGSANLNISEGNQGGVTPFHYNTHDITFAGGTPYSLEWIRTGYVRQQTHFYEDGYDHEVDQLDVPEDGCSHPTWIITNDPTLDGTGGKILDIYTHTITSTSNATTADGAIDIEVEGIRLTPMNGVDPMGFQRRWHFVSITDAGGTAACPDEEQQMTMGWFWINDGLGDGSDSDSGLIRGKGVETTATKLVAYPNPLETSTQVVFMTTETTHTTVNLYSIDGKKVQELFKGATIVLNTEALPNGVYIIQLTTPTGEQQQQKLLIAH